MYGAHGQQASQQQYSQQQGYAPQQQPPPQQQQYQQPPPPQQQYQQPPQQQQQQQQQYQYPPQQQQPAPTQQPPAQPAPAPVAAPAPAVVEPEPAPDGTARPIYVDTQHDDMVHDAQLDYYGTKLATGSSDRTIKVYDVAGNSYSPNATLTGHSGPIYQLAWSHPKFGSVLASASFDASVRVHRESRPGEWILVKAFAGLHEGSVNSVAFAPQEHGLCAAAGSSDGRVSVLSHEADDSWTVEYLRDTPLGVNAVSWAPYGVAAEVAADGSAVPLPPTLATGGSDNGIRIWVKDAATGRWEQEELASAAPDVRHTDWVRDVAWSPAVVPGRDVLASCSEDRTVIVWKRERGGDGAGDGGDASPPPAWHPAVLHTFDDPVWRVSWSVTGNILAVSSGDATVTLWKEGLDGSYSQVSQVDDVAGGNKGDEAVAGQ